MSGFHAPAGPGRSVRLGFTAKIGLLLALPLIGSMATIPLVTRYLDRTKTDNHFINVAGRQRMLSASIRDEVNMVAMGQDENRKGLQNHIAAFDEALAAMERGGDVLGTSLAPPPEEVAAPLAAVRDLWRGLKPELAAIAARQRKDFRFEAYRARPEAENLRDLSHQVVTIFSARSSRLRAEMITTLWLISGLTGLIFLASILLARRYIIHPILRMHKAALRIGAGDFTQRLDISTGDEMSDLASVFNDMTTRIQRLLAALDMSRRHAEIIVANMPAGLLALSEDLAVLRANRSFCETFGVDAAELARRPGLTDLIAAQGLKEAALDVLSTGRSKRGLQFNLVDKDGSKRSLRVSIAGTRHEKEEERLVIVIDDISLNEELTRVAVEMGRRYHEIMENALDAIIVMGEDGLISYLNAAAERMFGYERPEMLGQPVTMLMPKRYREAHERGVQRYIKTGQPSILGRVTSVDGLRRGGETFPLELSINSHRADAQYVFTAVLRDVTERRRNEAALAERDEQLRQSQKLDAVGKLAGGIAHDFNNLLTAILGFSAFLLQNLKPDDPNREDVLGIEAAAKRAADLTQQILAFGRKQMLSPRRLDLNIVVQDILGMLRRLVREDIDLSLRLSDQPLAVRVDQGQIEQVIINLVVNARDALPKGGKITIATSAIELVDARVHRDVAIAPGSYATLTLSDTGAGMSPEVREHIFEPFFTTKEPGKGTGLGLSTVYGIIAQSGGHITVDSAQGRGSTFRIYLPKAGEPPEDVESAPPPKKEIPRGSGVVLLVEDEPAVSDLARRILTQNGFTVIAAADPVDALALCESRKAPIRLLVTDMIMPRLNGLEVARKVRAARPTTPVLYISGYTQHPVIELNTAEHKSAFLQKPFTPDAFLEKIHELLD